MKNKLKYLIIIFVALIFTITLTSCENKTKLYVATSPDYAPYEFIDSRKSNDDKYVGADISLAKYIAKKQNKVLELQIMGFDELLTSVQTGKSELAISGFTYSASRAENYEMSISYYDDGEGDQVVITKTSTKDKFSTFEQLNNKDTKIAAQSGSVQYDYVKEQLPNATIEQIGNLADAFTQLDGGKVDAIAIAGKVAKVKLEGSTKYSLCDFSFDVTGRTGMFAISQKGNVDFINSVNEIIKEVKEKGLFNEWIEEANKIVAELENASDVIFIVKVWNMFTNNFGEFMKGLGITLLLSLCGVVFAIILGILLCLMNLSKSKILHYISQAYIEVIRGIPLLLQLTVIFLIMPRGMPKFVTCVIALIINSGAYQAEIFRSGIQAVDNGQMEAARSLGLSQAKTMWKVILPQAVKNILPALGNEFVSLIKETSLASTFYVGDLMTVKTIITATTYDALTPYVIIGLIYFVITFTLSKLIKYFEKKVTC